ncbi:MAG: hypothetical protein KF884_07265 [Fimbriimonadaceae bacterium]|nr:hypothetical protein [Fimbriimonadaceae bacterium]QYK57348.1 MAG: hypothetical protein KF884_07265 [Fimbriimonadaceae bacterium]
MLLFVALVVSAFATAAISAWVPAQGEGVPLYFSGTKAIASGGTATNVGILVSMRLYLNEHQVASWDYDGGPHVVFQGGLRVMFDSSHFPDQSWVTVRMWAKNSLNEVAEATRQVRVKNQCTGINLPEFLTTPGGNGAWELSQQMAGSNYHQVTFISPGWNRDTCWEAMRNPSVYYIASHGYGESHETSIEDPQNPGSPELVLWQDYEYFRSWHNDPGLPPFNVCENPPVTFAYIDACHCGRSNAFGSLLYPYYDGYGNFVKDQAVLTWNGKGLVKSTQNGVYWYFHRLLAMDTIFSARDYMLEFMPDSTKKVYMKLDHFPWQRLVNGRGDMPIWGDPHTRIKGVYTGNPFRAPAGWYRPL